MDWWIEDGEWKQKRLGGEKASGSNRVLLGSSQCPKRVHNRWDSRLFCIRLTCCVDSIYLCDSATWHTDNAISPKPDRCCCALLWFTLGYTRSTFNTEKKHTTTTKTPPNATTHTEKVTTTTLMLMMMTMTTTSNSSIKTKSLFSNKFELAEKE